MTILSTFLFDSYCSLHTSVDQVAMYFMVGGLQGSYTRGSTLAHAVLQEEGILHSYITTVRFTEGRQNLSSESEEKSSESK